MAIYFSQVNSDISLENYKFLFQLLKKRKFNISHKLMPSWEEHIEFVKSSPYFKWYIISENYNKIGSFYINHDNSIGLNLIEEKKLLLENIITKIENTFEPQKGIKSIRSEHFFYNVNPNDKVFIKALEDKGYKISKISFKRKKI